MKYDTKKKNTNHKNKNTNRKNKTKNNFYLIQKILKSHLMSILTKIRGIQ